ncbi:hypothetical protein MTP10_40405 [Nonomuraea sp. 3-1Str]|uniref:hypothetical protein n=1 Tax=Nonomuraea sp. 3-1Str TaxID=2929801 RepID=UPI00285BD597|nr:hypothetical protein [Nonomuraea sp. 3-1Str]MDR8414979.1 hypothetical protein [Nonomuraea sp. 3-1Str]
MAVRDSGTATASASGFANSGIVEGDVYQILPQPVARSAYLHTVQRIAPAKLIDRDTELIELTRFCATTDGSRYLYWQAPAWAGKSALLSWFVMHPPAGMQIASFFITARFSGQSDRRAFIRVVAEQLAEVAMQPMPVLTDATEEAHFLEMLKQAAAICHQERRRLILVVDGLDEDRGVILGPEAHSIAALMPAQLPDNVRVIIAGRPDPPIPSDVPDDHPLRDISIVRRLDASPRAQVIRADAERELRRLLHGTVAQQDLLGLVTAAGGGLSSRDLAELTDLDPWEIEEHLHTVSGRTFATRESLWRSEVVYVLAHEELQKTSTHYLAGTRLQNYRQRLHAWADRYQQESWPVGTPEYLLGGYFKLLNEVGEHDRLVICALDRSRHNRMLDVTGGDADALNEITTVQRIVASQTSPDMLTSLRLAVARHHLKDRNQHIPANLPAVWAKLGYLTRGEALARSITDPYHQTRAFVRLIHIAAQAEKMDQARQFAEHAEQIAHAVTNAHQQAQVMAELAKTLAHVHSLDWAEQIACTIANPYQRAQALADLANTAADIGELDCSERITASIADAEQQVRALIHLAKAQAKTGAIERGCHLARQTQRIVDTISDSHLRVQALSELAEIAIGADQSTWARDLIQQAENIVELVRHADQKVWALACLVRAHWEIGNANQAYSLTIEAEKTARFIPNTYEQVWALAHLAMAIVKLGRVDRAEKICRKIANTKQQAQVMAGLASFLANAGDIDGSLKIVRLISQPEHKIDALGHLAEVTAGVGNIDVARHLSYEAEEIARTITNPKQQAQALAGLADLAADTGEMDRAYRLNDEAEQIARTITNIKQQAHALAELAEAVAVNGELHHAELLAHTITNPTRKAWALGGLVKIAVERGDFARAEQLAYAIRNLHYHYHVEVLANLAEAIARAGDLVRAEQISRTIADIDQQIRALGLLARTANDAEDFERARHFIDQGELLLCNDTDAREWAVANLAETAICVGDVERAIRLAFTIIDIDQQAWALGNIAKIASDIGEWAAAEQVASAISDTYRQARALAQMSSVAIEQGETDRAYRLTDQAEQIAHTLTYTYQQALILDELAKIVASMGELDRAELMARTIPEGRDGTLADIAQIAINLDNIERAEQIVNTIADPQEKSRAISFLVRRAAQLGDIDGAGQLADKAQHAAEAIAKPYAQAWALTDLAEVAADTGDMDRTYRLIDRAELVASTIEDTDDRARALASLAKSVAEIGDLDRAEEIARTVADANQQTSALADIAKTAARIGDIHRAEKVAQTIPNAFLQMRALVDITEYADPIRARRIIASGLVEGSWWLPLRALATIAPDALNVLADDLLIGTRPALPT